MGKKKIYNLKEHERYEKRVDIFRTVQQSPHKAVYQMNSVLPPKIVMVKGSNAYVNQSYLTSEMTLDQMLRLGLGGTGGGENNKNPLYVSEDPVWTTKASFNAVMPITEEKFEGEEGEQEEVEDEEEREQERSKSRQNAKHDITPNMSKQPLPPPPPHSSSSQQPISLPIMRYPSKAEFYPPLNQLDDPIKASKKRRRKICMFYSFMILLLIILAALAVLLVLFLKPSQSSNSSQQRQTNKPTPLLEPQPHQPPHQHHQSNTDDNNPTEPATTKGNLKRR